MANPVVEQIEKIGQQLATQNVGQSLTKFEGKPKLSKLKRRQVKCYFCQDVGHVKAQCPERQSELLN